MTRKHYRQAAQMLQAVTSSADRENVAVFLVALFKADNPRFDVDTFLGAAGFNVAEFRKETGI